MKNKKRYLTQKQVMRRNRQIYISFKGPARINILKSYRYSGITPRMIICIRGKPHSQYLLPYILASIQKTTNK
jgi:hypothetical protein